jgi:catechol 2,3-dioxygenase-like lactoylglutathione lyase family enzyme
MQLAYTILYVDDVRKSVDFYEQAFGLRRKFIHDGGDYGEMDTGGTALAFSSRDLMRQLGKHPQPARWEAPCFEVAFTTADVTQALERAVSAGAELVQAPEQMPWGQTTAYVADLDGFLVEICTPVNLSP